MTKTFLSKGGLGSAIALARGSFKAGPNGTFTGRLIAQPDRGYNVFVISFLLAHTAVEPTVLTISAI